MHDRRAVYSCALLAAIFAPLMSIGVSPSQGKESTRDAVVVSRQVDAVSTASVTPSTPAAAPEQADQQELRDQQQPDDASPAPEDSGPDADQPEQADPPAEQPAPAAPPPPAEPSGSLLDNNQMVVFYGTPLSARMGILGVFEAEEAARRVKAQAGIYDGLNGDKGMVPAFDLIYAVAQSQPTSNGLYLRYLPDNVVQRYIDLADQYDLQIMLDLQIGRGRVIDEVKKIERFLAHPRVHVAIDPEYAVGPNGRPIATPGRISGHDINEVQDYLAHFVEERGLPRKLVVLHQFMDRTVVEGEATRQVENVDLVLNMDAFGAIGEKDRKYKLYATRPYAEHSGFNIFLKQDERVLTEEEVLRISPSPDIIFYQ